MVIGIEAAHAAKKQRTGVERYCFEIIQHLKKTIPATERVVLYTNEKADEQPELFSDLPPNWSVKVLRWPFRKLWSQIRLSIEFIFHKPDVFFAPGQLIPFFVPKATVATIHDSAFIAMPEAYRFLGRQYLSWMNKRIIQKAMTIVTPSEFSRNEIGRMYGAEAESKVCVTPLACTIDDYAEPIDRFEIESVLKKYYISKPFFLTIGRLESKKNTAGIIRSFARASEKIRNWFPEMTLVLVGKPGAGYDEVAEELKNSPEKKHIKTVGYISQREKICLLQAAQAFIFYSKYEGFGLPILEAMAAGCPVLAADIPPFREVGGGDVWYADPLDEAVLSSQIMKISRDLARREEMIARGRERVKIFSWEKTAEQTWQIIAELTRF